MAAGWPTKANYATGDVLTATNMNDLSGTVNYIDPTSATDGQVLTRDAASAGKVKWASPTTATTAYTLLSTTSISGSGSTTISSLSGYNKLFVVVYQAASATANNEIKVRPNNNSGSNYNWGAGFITGASSWAATNVQGSSNAVSATEIDFAKLSSSGGDCNGYLFIDGANSSSGKKPIQYASGVGAGGGNAHRNYTGYTVYNEAAVISSLNIRVTSGTFSAGTVYIWGAN